MQRYFRYICDDTSLIYQYTVYLDSTWDKRKHRNPYDFYMHDSPSALLLLRQVLFTTCVLQNACGTNKSKAWRTDGQTTDKMIPTWRFASLAPQKGLASQKKYCRLSSIDWEIKWHGFLFNYLRSASQNVHMTCVTYNISQSIQKKCTSLHT